MRKRISQALATSAAVVFVLLATVAIAQAADSVRATVVGTDYCLGCTLKKEKGAAAQCSIYGHRHALKLEQITTEGGGEVGIKKGITLHYLENDKSKDLVKGSKFHGKRIEVVGKVYPEERIIEVESVREVLGVPKAQ